MFKEITVVLYFIVIVLSQNEQRCDPYEDQSQECNEIPDDKLPPPFRVPETTDNPEPIDQETEDPQKEYERKGRKIKRVAINNEWGLVWQQLLANERRYSSSKGHVLPWTTSTHLHLPDTRVFHRPSQKSFAHPFQHTTIPYYAIVVPKSLKHLF